MKNILVLAFIAIGFQLQAQIEFEKGYYIDDSGKHETLIKNIDWKNNPSEIEIKASENATPTFKSISEISEFVIINQAKYIKREVKIDYSSTNLSEISKQRNPEFKTKTVLLKTLIEGDAASLYTYEESNLKRFFYALPQEEIQPLIYKQFVAEFNDKLLTNASYKQELLNHLKCDNISLTYVENTDYKEADLTRFFIRFHECKNAKYINYKNKTHRNVFKLNIRPGLIASSLKVIDGTSTYYYDTEFDTRVRFRFGVEAEIFLPFNKDKWSLIVEPTYHYHKNETERVFKNDYITDPTEDVTLDYTSIQIPLGVRYYMFLNDDAQIFVNAGYLLDFSISSQIQFQQHNNIDITSENNLVFGAGFKYKRLSAEARFGFERDLLVNYDRWDTKGNHSISLIFGYTLFE